MGKSRPQGRASKGLAFSYIRWSRPEQATGDSLRRQMDLTRDWCARNGVPLDESLTFRDEGVSAFTGEHRSNPDRFALAAFVEAVAAGRVPADSYLVIENLDRLSREHVRPAVRLFLDLLDRKVNVVTTSPERVYRHDSSDMLDIMVAVVELSRGHSESARRSERCGAAWREKKRRAAADKKPITRVVPAWVRVAGDRFELIPEKAAVVRRIYALARDGHGIEAIVKKLAGEGVPPISEGKRRGRHWSVSYVADILNSRAAAGEYQPHRGKFVRGNPKARQPDGEPIPNYFPAAVTEDEWHATRAAVAGRRRAGRERTAAVNVFKSLLTDARTGTPMHAMKRKGGQPVLYPYAYTTGRGPFVSFPLDVFEREVFARLREVDPRELMPRQDPATARVAELAEVAAGLRTRIEGLKAALVAGDPPAAAVDALRELEAKLAAVNDDLADARRRASAPLAEAWADARSLIDLLGTAADQRQARTRLRAAVRRIVDAAFLLIVRRGDVTLCGVQLRFAGGRERAFILWYRPAKVLFGGPRRRPAAGGSVGGAWAEPAKRLDLGTKKGTAALEAALEGLDLGPLTAGPGNR